MWCQSQRAELLSSQMNGPWRAELVPAGRVPLKMMLSDNVNQFSISLSHFRAAGFPGLRHWKCAACYPSRSKHLTVVTVLDTLQRERPNDGHGRGRSGRRAGPCPRQSSLLPDETFPSCVKALSFSSLTQRLRAIPTNSKTDQVRYFSEMNRCLTNRPARLPSWTSHGNCPFRSTRQHLFQTHCGSVAFTWIAKAELVGYTPTRSTPF